MTSNQLSRGPSFRIKVIGTAVNPGDPDRDIHAKVMCRSFYSGIGGSMFSTPKEVHMIGQTIYHYRIVEELGAGGMGIVYKAQDTKLDRTVALKFLPSHLSASEEDKARFVREAKAASAINHPNICTIHDILEYEGPAEGKPLAGKPPCGKRLFIVMEFVDGEPLRSRIGHYRAGEGLPLRQAVDWTIQLAGGLKAAHAKKIIHRDIKPENIIVTRDGLLKIMDFGVARFSEAGEHAEVPSSGIPGTVAYMSPEQVQGIEADTRSDIWSLGVVVYEMLTGELPFKAEHVAALEYLIVNEDPLPPSAHDRRIPQALDGCVMHMLDKNRERRTQSCDEVLAAMGRIAGDLEYSEISKEQKSLALLPFQNISPDREGDYFSDGLTEELIHNLSRLQNIRVVSRTSIMQYKNTRKNLSTIGQELGVGYILEGSIRKFHDDLRITVQLVDVRTDTQLWAEKYRGKLSDIFDIQEEVSREIVSALTVKLSPAEKHSLIRRFTENPEAFDYNLRAREALYRMTKQDLKSAIQLFNRALELDNHYALAYAGLGQVYADLYFSFERKEEHLDKSIEACLKALSYDATLAEAYAALGLAYFDKKMLEESLPAVRKAIELNPKSFMAYWILGRIYHTTDRDREAIEPYKKVVDLNPDFYAVHMDLRTVYERLGDKEHYEEAVRNELEVYPKYLARFPEDPRAHIFFAVALARAKCTDRAKSEAAKAIELNPYDPLMLYNSACFYAQIGEKDLAITTLKDSIEAGLENFEWIKRDPDLETIRNDPRYEEIMRGK